MDQHQHTNNIGPRSTLPDERPGRAANDYIQKNLNDQNVPDANIHPDRQRND